MRELSLKKKIGVEPATSGLAFMINYPQTCPPNITDKLICIFLNTLSPETKTYYRYVMTRLYTYFLVTITDNQLNDFS